MDTIENNAGPAGSDDVTSSPDTPAEVDTQTAETEQGVDGAPSEEAGQAPETLLAGKYKSPQDLEKAYKELEGKLGDLGQKASVAELLQEKYGVTPEQLRETIEAQEQARLEHELATNPAGYALREVETLKQELALKEVQTELDGFLQQNPEYAPFKDKILNLGLNLEREKGFDQIAQEYFGQAIAHGQQTAYQKIETKKNTQATPVSSVAKKQFSTEDLKNLSVAELEALLPKSDNPYM